MRAAYSVASERQGQPAFPPRQQKCYSGLNAAMMQNVIVLRAAERDNRYETNTMTRHLASLRTGRGVRSGSPPARAARAAVAATWLVFLLLGAWGQAADSPPPIPQQTASPPGDLFIVSRSRARSNLAGQHAALGICPRRQFRGRRPERSADMKRLSGGPRVKRTSMPTIRRRSVTPIYVHGNQIDSSLAASYGLSFYFELVESSILSPPLRFVIWSWPSDQVRGPLCEMRSKADRSDTHAVYLGQFVAPHKPEAARWRLGLQLWVPDCQRSDGARGGRVAVWSVLDLSVDPASTRSRGDVGGRRRQPIGICLDRFHGQCRRRWRRGSTPSTAATPCSRYHWLDRHSNPSAAGYAGIYGRNLLPPDINARIEEVNVTNIVGAEHNWRRYLYSRYIQDRTRDYVMWHPLLGVVEPAGMAAVEVR